MQTATRKSHFCSDTLVDEAFMELFSTSLDRRPNQRTHTYPEKNPERTSASCSSAGRRIEFSFLLSCLARYDYQHSEREAVVGVSKLNAWAFKFFCHPLNSLRLNSIGEIYILSDFLLDGLFPPNFYNTLHAIILCAQAFFSRKIEGVVVSEENDSTK